jgi:hypothetical protein
MTGSGLKTDKSVTKKPTLASKPKEDMKESLEDPMNSKNRCLQSRQQYGA